VYGSHEATRLMFLILASALSIQPMGKREKDTVRQGRFSCSWPAVG